MTASAIRASTTAPQPHAAPGSRSARQGGSEFLDAYEKAAGGGTTQTSAAATDDGTAETPNLPDQASPDNSPSKGKDATGRSDDPNAANAGDGTATAETEAEISADAAQAIDAASADAVQPDAKTASDAVGTSDTPKETHHGKGSKDAADKADDDTSSKDKSKDVDASSVIAAIVVTQRPVLPVARTGADDGGGKGAADANAASIKPSNTAASDGAGPAVLDVTEVTTAPASGTRSALLTFNARLAALQSGAPQADGHASAASKPEPTGTDDAGSGLSEKAKTGLAQQGSDAAGTRDLSLMMGLGGDRAGLSQRNIDGLAGRIASAAAGNATTAPSVAQNADERAPGVVNSLKIELHPAELGSVTATLRASGNSLAINLTVTTDAAYQSLSADNGALVDKLKGHGYVVEQITVQHVGATSTVQQAGGQQPGASTAQDNGARFGAQGQQSSFGQGRQSGSGGGAFSSAPDPVAAADDAGGADGIYL